MKVTYGKWLYFWNSRVSVWGYLLSPVIQWSFHSVRIWKIQKRGWDKSPSLSIVLGLSSKTQWLSGLYYADFISFYSPTQLCGGGTTKSNSNELPISVPLSLYCFFLKASKPAKKAREPPKIASREVSVPVFGKTFSVEAVSVGLTLSCCGSAASCFWLSDDGDVVADGTWTSLFDKLGLGLCSFWSSLTLPWDGFCWMSLLVSLGFSSWAGLAFLIRKIVAVSGARVNPLPVSYTHLTLPTICSV